MVSHLACSTESTAKEAAMRELLKKELRLCGSSTWLSKKTSTSGGSEARELSASMVRDMAAAEATLPGNRY